MKAKKIKIPQFIDDPIVGRTLVASPTPFILPFMHDHILIEEGTLWLKYSKTSSTPPKSFRIEDISKIIVAEKEVSCWDKDNMKFDLYSPTGTEISLYLVDNNGNKNELDHAVLVVDIGPVSKGRRPHKAPEFSRRMARVVNTHIVFDLGIEWKDHFVKRVEQAGCYEALSEADKEVVRQAEEEVLQSHEL